MGAVVPGGFQTIDEFLTLLALEREFSLVVVEGRTDAAFFGHYLQASGLDIAVSAVNDRFAITRDECSPYWSDFGAKAKAVALAMRVNDEIGTGQNRVTVVVDADSAASLGPRFVSSGCLFETDFPSLEHYSLQPEPFARFTAFGVRKVNAPTSEEVKSSIGSALRTLSAISATLHEYGVGVTDRVFNSCSVEAGIVNVDAVQVLEKSLASHNWSGSPRPKLKDLLPISAGYLDIFEASDHPGRGHDIAPLLILLLQLNKPFNAKEVVEAILRASIHPDELHDFPLFRTLLTRHA